jgi:dienelactone hydrolase
VLRAANIGTLLMDLLTVDEDSDYRSRFNIALLTRRLSVATEWLQRRPEAAAVPIGYFGASTGAAAALQAAAELGEAVGAVVSRGGRPDLAGETALGRVASPTLLLVGGLDGIVIDLNRAAFDALRCEKELSIIPGATHLFEEPGTLEDVARQATAWFARHLRQP